MDAGQKVRVIPASPFGPLWSIPGEAQGTVLCRYRLLRNNRACATRVDVQFGPKFVVWGAPGDQFEVVEDNATPSGDHFSA